MISDQISDPHYESMQSRCGRNPSWVLADSVTSSTPASFQLERRWLTHPVVSFPSLPPRLELVVLLVGAAAGYNLTMQILPHQQIDLAQLEVDEQSAAPVALQESAPAIDSSHAAPPEVSVSNPQRSFLVCAVPVGGGPALNEHFEPC